MGSQEDNPQMLVGAKGGSLEIFLFTNGQQESPPRKYNVRVNDRWDTTLNFLARSQNGSNHTIELYTTEGKKVERGQDLINGAAYVAVEPPHAFLPAGYNDYLMKASRSREKRQEKISEDNLLIKPDKDNSKDKIEKESKHGDNIKTIPDITSSRTAVEEQDDITNQVKSDVSKAVKPVRRTSIKHPQKKSNPLPQQNPHILRKNANNVTPPIRRGINPTKVDASKKKVDISSLQHTKNSIASAKAESVIMKTNESKSKGDEAGFIGVSRTRNTETDIASMPGTVVTGYKETQNLTPDATIIERNILLPLSPVKDNRESAYIIPFKMRSMALLSNRKDIVSVSSRDIKNIHDIVNSSPSRASSHPQADFPKALNRNESKADILNDMPSERLKKKTLIFGSQTNDNNFAIYVKQGNTVNLKLNIEVNNAASTTSEENYNKLSSSSVEKTPGYNIAGGKNYRHAPTLTEPWLAGLPCEQVQQITNDLRVGMCNCCPCSRNPESVEVPVYVDNNNYFVLLPPEDVNEHLVSCICKLETNPQSKREIPDYKVAKLSRIQNRVVNLDEGNNLPPHTSNMAENFEITKKNLIHDPVSIENQLLSEKGSITEGDGNQCDCFVVSAHYPTSPCGCAQSLGLECSTCGHEPETSDLVKQTSPGYNKPILLKEAFTQTVWSGIVLEARPREDGSYAFHIPSLKVLKNTNYLY